ncbi:piwi-like protein 1, partial [Syngnathoides biaculeatus]|uniref:piwi-like protein 1 n=1 Tax=Syngnathoides biaculeatus TaxID=300417 RepID=UPI002ADDE93B
FRLESQHKRFQNKQRSGWLAEGRQKSATYSEEAVLEISAGFQQVSIGERGGRRRDLNDAGVNTRQTMEHVKASKSGTSVSPIQLSANFFHILSRPQRVLYQYHMDFKPPMESRRLRSALLFQHERTLGNVHYFDGGILFMPQRLPNKVPAHIDNIDNLGSDRAHENERAQCVPCVQVTVPQSLTGNGEKVEIIVTLTNELPPTSPVCLQLYIIFRRILRLLGMQQIGRNYYDAKDPLSILQHKLTIWPGYTTGILEYESAIMLCIDVSHKVLRSETVLDFMINLRQRCGPHSFTDVCAKELVGLIVLTEYNNKTHRIDDIAWDQTPCNTFTREDTDISFKNYYKTRYGVEIQDSNQVLLVSRVKRLARGQTPPGPALLIPELCYLTGLTDKMRADYTIMKDLSAHTKLVPEQRAGRLLRFSENINK